MGPFQFASTLVAIKSIVGSGGIKLNKITLSNDKKLCSFGILLERALSSRAKIGTCAHALGAYNEQW